MGEEQPVGRANCISVVSSTPSTLKSERQSAAHPSPPVVLPSSQTSPASKVPLPHTETTQTEGSPLQKKLVSSAHIASQPSPAATFPSSQVSPISMAPFPQVAVSQEISRLNVVVSVLPSEVYRSYAT